MHRSIQRCLTIALLVTSVAAPHAARAEGDLQVTLQAHRVASDADGKESLTTAEAAKPGDVVEYRATYANPHAGDVRHVQATLPIPRGMEYLPRTAQPAQVLASVDGKAFASVPLTHKVRLADGREVVREIPSTEYRYLRWSLGAIPAHATQDVRARVRVSPVAGSVAASVAR